MRNILILLCLCGSLLAQNNFKVEQVLQGDVKAEDLQPKKLKAKLILVDFWATWCMPCIANIAEWNKLYDDYKIKGVEFIAISDEATEKVKAFLGKRIYKGIMAVDTDGSIFKEFSVIARPSTLVFDGDGNLKGKIYPALIKDSLMQRWLNNDFSFFTRMEKKEAKLDVGRFYAGHDPVINAYCNFVLPKQETYQVILRPSPVAQMRGSYAYTESAFSYCGGKIKKLYAFLNDLSSANRVIYAEPDTSAYDVIYNDPNCRIQDSMWKEVNRLCSMYFKVKPELKKLKQNAVYVSGSNSTLKKSSELDIQKRPEEKLYKSIEELVQKCEEKSESIFVMDEKFKDLTIDTYELGTKLWSMNSQEIQDWLRSKGFTFTEKAMEIEMLELK